MFDTSRSQLQPDDYDYDNDDDDDQDDDYVSFCTSGSQLQPGGKTMMTIRASHHEATFSMSLAWVFFWCLFMVRIDLKNLKNLGRSFHEWKMV